MADWVKVAAFCTIMLSLIVVQLQITDVRNRVDQVAQMIIAGQKP